MKEGSMDNGSAMREALANVRKMARDTVLERYKSKKSKPAEAAPSGDEPAPEMESLEEEMAEEPEHEAGGEHDSEMEIIVLGGRTKKKPALANMMKMDEPMPVKKKRGRPPKQK